MEWEHQGAWYLSDPLSDVVYTLSDWPQPVGRIRGQAQALRLEPLSFKALLGPLIRALAATSHSSDHSFGEGAPMAHSRLDHRFGTRAACLCV